MSEPGRHDRFHVTAILVVHDGATWLPEVVASLASQTRPIDLTIAVDTDSQDSSGRLLTRARVPSISLPRDTGFGAAVAAGAEYSREAGRRQKGRDGDENEWLWLIHDDCAPEPGALQALLDGVENRPQVAIAGPKLRGWYDRAQLLEVGVSIAGNGARWTGLEPHEYDQGQHDGIREVLSVSTAGMLIRRDVFDEIGGFDLNLSLFRDDVDLGWRTHVAGHSVIIVSDAVAFHAEASTQERRRVDVKSAFFHHGLLLDRRNAAYVLLANSTWWMLPWVALQLFSSAALRATGYLLAKLPSYALDEFLAVCLLLIKPGDVWKARKDRKKHRLISPRVVSTFIPPRWSQLRLGFLRLVEAIRFGLLPSPPESSDLLAEPNEDDDILTPSPPARWRSALRRPEISGFILVFLISTFWASHRFGSLVGGALPRTPTGAIDLWRKYGESWHQVGMGSSSATPTWVVVLALLSTVLFGKAAFLITLIFWLSPLLFMWSMYSLLRRFSQNSWLVVGGALSYALSPVSIASINSGRLGTIAVLIAAPRIAIYLPKIVKIEIVTWRFIFGLSLLIGLVTSFSLLAFLGITFIHIFALLRDYLLYKTSQNRDLFKERVIRRVVLIFTPFLLTMPWSLEAIFHPSRFLTEPGFSVSGGGPNLALIANPGGAGSLPWWVISPVTFVLIVSIFSTAGVRKYSASGLFFLVLATYLSAISIASHASSTPDRVWVGSLLAFATVAALCSGVIILDGLRQRLADVHFHFRHLLGGVVIASTLLYGAVSTVWAVSVGSDSPVHASEESVLPPFLAATSGVKTLVLRNLPGADANVPSFFIAQESDASLADPDVAPPVSDAVDGAIREIVNGSGIGSSAVLSGYGIKYLFMKNPVDIQLVRVVDGLGGFIRNSSTKDGVVWRIAGASERVVYTNNEGKSIAIPSESVSANGYLTGKGKLFLAENYNAGWRVIQGGKHLPLEKSEFGLPAFTVTHSGAFTLIHDGTIRRAWLALEMIIFLTVVVFALPAGRRKREISRSVIA